MQRSQDEKATAEGYDRWADSYDDTDPSTWLDEPFLFEHLKPFPGCRILDVGCGTGRYLRRLPESAYRIIGADLSCKMLGKARQLIGGRTDVCLVQASVSRLPFRASSFDRIMSGLVIDHVASIEQLFRELCTVLAPDGHAVVAAVHPDMQRLTGSDIEIPTVDQKTIHIPGHVHEVEHLLTAAREAGMTVIAMDEPRITPLMLKHRPDWTKKVGHCALVLLALGKSGRPK